MSSVLDDCEVYLNDTLNNEVRLLFVTVSPAPLFPTPAHTPVRLPWRCRGETTLVDTANHRIGLQSQTRG